MKCNEMLYGEYDSDFLNSGDEETKNQIQLPNTSLGEMYKEKSC